ncbi:unnamed protein product [Moneuplotes crassus]|uniref:Uncharacterized protein n=1 Tax=Euplotes crassus TaxID=5936 RepID=A0AAD1X915_EUPCR|nr:unnamed protein product [Moneuplotes crassus]
MSWKERVLKRSDDEKRKERIDDLHKWARWLPDSAYQSYFGRPAFHCYGRDNTVPSYGGHVYGDYMLTHNVNPEHGENMPKYQQVYRAAMSKGFAHGDRVPVLSRQRRENLEIPDSVLKEMMKRNPIMPKTYVEPPNTDEYTDGSDNEWDFSQLEKKNKNRNKIDFHPKKKQSKEEIKDCEQDVKSDQEDDGKENEMEEFDQNDIDQEGNQPGYIYERAPRGSIPQPGTLEYKRMLEQFLRNPEKCKTILRDGEDLQNLFPFCSAHNSYGQQLPNHELNPKNYKFLPSEYTRRIAPAGKNTLKGDQLYNVILPEE